MARRRTTKKTTRRKPVFNVINFGFDVAGASQLTRLVTNQGLAGAIIDPIMNWSKGWAEYPQDDNALNIKEIIGVGILGQDGGVISGSRAFAGGSGRTTILKAMGENVRKNAIPVAINLAALKVGKKLLRKTGVARSFNRLLKFGGLEKMVRF